MFTADENDHLAGGMPNPAGCDRVNTPCNYSHVNCPSATVPTCPADNVGELNANMTGLLATQPGITTPFSDHSDSAPTVYLTGNPAPSDPVEMKLPHMITADPARTPPFTSFANPDYFLFAGAPNCNSPCVQTQFGFAWNHGSVTPDITTTWLGLAGPGVDDEGVTKEVWSYRTDVRPTILR